MTWLDELGDDPDSEVRDAVAYLASYSFGYLLEKLIRLWIIRSRRSREVAALALGVLGRDDPRFTGRCCSPNGPVGVRIPGGRRRWPGRGGNLRERILVLWGRALADDVLAELAGRMLCGWAHEADIQTAASDGQQPELVGALGRLVAAIGALGRRTMGTAAGSGTPSTGAPPPWMFRPPSPDSSSTSLAEVG